MIALSVVGVVVFIGSIVVVVALCRRKEFDADATSPLTEHKVVELQGPRKHVEVEERAEPFTVSDRDHAEMVREAEDSMSIGLEAD